MKQIVTIGIIITTIFIFNHACAGEVPITEDNIKHMLGEWEGSRSGRRSGHQGGTAPVTMKVFSVYPVRAKILFYQGPEGTLTFGLRGKLEDGYIVGIMKGKMMPSIKLIFYENKGGELELRGQYKSTRGGTQFRGDLELEKIKQ